MRTTKPQGVFCPRKASVPDQEPKRRDSETSTGAPKEKRNDLFSRIYSVDLFLQKTRLAPIECSHDGELVFKEKRKREKHPPKAMV